MLFLLAGLVADLIVLGFAYANGDSLVIILGTIILGIIAVLMVHEIEKVRPHAH